MTCGGTSQSGAHAAYDAYQSRSYFGNLDGLRFICIVMVLWHHNPGLRDSGVQLLERGFLGVDFFFVLSGYLITTLILREMATCGTFSLRDFYQRRLVRIVPVYYFVVTCVGAYYIFVKGKSHLLDLWPHYYLFLSNFLIEDIPLLSITWSLSMEEQYYLIWPLIMLLVPRRFLWAICTLFIVVNIAAGAGALGGTAPAAGPLLFEMPRPTYAPIIMGSLAAILLQHGPSFRVLHRICGGYSTALILLVALAIAMHLTPQDINGWPNLMIHTLMTSMLVSLVMREHTILTPVLAHPLVARVGVVSYGIYLYHLIALDITNRFGSALFGPVNPWVSFIAYSIIAFVIAEISFRTLETWFRRFRPKPRAAPTRVGV